MADCAGGPRREEPESGGPRISSIRIALAHIRRRQLLVESPGCERDNRVRVAELALAPQFARRKANHSVVIAKPMMAVSGQEKGTVKVHKVPSPCEYARRSDSQ